jgi:hypothetical protein
MASEGAPEWTSRKIEVDDNSYYYAFYQPGDVNGLVCVKTALETVFPDYTEKERREILVSCRIGWVDNASLRTHLNLRYLPAHRFLKLVDFMAFLETQLIRAPLLKRLRTITREDTGPLSPDHQYAERYLTETRQMLDLQLKSEALNKLLTEKK